MVNNNARFLAAIDSAAKDEILAGIAKHYGISDQEAYAEVADDSAEHLLNICWTTWWSRSVPPPRLSFSVMACAASNNRLGKPHEH